MEPVLLVGGDKEHATYSASGSERWLNCPGSIHLSEQAPEQVKSKYAAEGTAAHGCLEFLLKNRDKLKAAIELAQKDPVWTPDMIEHAAAAVKQIVDWQKALPGSEILCERKVDSSSFTCGDQFGTLDASVVQEFGKLIIIDYKYGAGIAVEPVDEAGEANPQLAYYALGVAHEYNYNFDEVELVVIQPRAYHESGEVTRTATFRMEEIRKWIPRFREGVRRTLERNPVFASGKWCRFCPAAVLCPELKENALKKAQVVFNDIEGLESVPEPRSIQLPNLGTILQGCDRLEDWIAKVREHAIHVLKRGEKVDGYKLVAKRSPRRWRDESIAAKEALRHFGESAFTEPKLLSPAQLEKAAKGIEGLDKWIADRTTNESSGTTLVHESDKRQAVTPAGAAFRNLDTLPSAATVLSAKLPTVKANRRK